MKSIRPEPGAWRRAFVPIVVLVAALFALLPAAALAADPISWSVTESKYGATPGLAPDTAFQAVPGPFAGIGMTAGAPKAYGMGIWQAAQSIYMFGFTNTKQVSAPPTMPQTDLAGKDIDTGTQLELKFTKTAGQRIDYFAVVCDTDARVTVEPEAGKTLTNASYFIVKATIVRPVKSASGQPDGGAFGLIANLSPAAAEDYMGAVFATTMHWVDVKPPTITSAGVAGLNADGFNGVTATFDGIFPPELLTKMGITDPANVLGYIDATQILPASTAATFEYKGTGADWNSGWYKYRLTNSMWSTHNVLYGRAVVFTPTVTLKLSGLTSGAMRLGRRVTAKGRVTPTSLAGSQVKLTVQKKRSARWVTVKRVARTISATGAYIWKYKPAAKGAYRMRATIARTVAHTAAKTKWRSFKVK